MCAILRENSPVWCIFCLKRIDQIENNNKYLLNTFFKFARRYLQLPPFESIESFKSCQDCACIIQNICDFYGEIKVLEMRLHWKLTTFKAITSSAGKVQQRLTDIQENGNGLFEKIKQIRKRLIRKSTEKLRSTYPKVHIQRCNSTKKNFKTENGVSIKSSIKIKSEMESESIAELSGTALSLPEPRSREIVSPIDFPEPFVAVVKQLIEPECDLISKEVFQDLEDIHHGCIAKAKPTQEDEDMNMGNIQSQEQVVSDFHLSSEVNEQKIDEPKGSDENVHEELPPLKSETCPNDDSSPLEELPAKIKTEKISPNKINFENPANWKKLAKTINRSMIARKRNDKMANPSLKELALKYLLETKYSCNKKPCVSKTFCNKTDLENHIKLHGKFKCNFCSIRGITYAPNLVKHEYSKHSNENGKRKKGISGKRKCPRCEFTETAVTSLTRHHISTHLNLIPNKNSCPICNIPLRRRSSAKNELLWHYQAFHDLKDMDLQSVQKCGEEDCRAYFRFSNQLTIHKTKVHDVPQDLKYECVECNERFMSLRFLSLHRRKMHYNNQTFRLKCSFNGCTKMFESETQMALHNNTHKIKKTKCKLCGKALNPYNLKLHLRTVHKPDDWLQGVKLVHDYREKYGIGAKVCKVKECQKRFYNLKDFNVHSQLHGSFHCKFENCSESFSFAPKLALHEITHSRESPSASSSYDRIYKCPRCMKTRNNETSYLEHFLTHLSLKLDINTCPICEVVFVYSPDRKDKDIMQIIKEHFKLKHDLNKIDPTGIQYKCEEDECSAYFVTKFQLTTHQNWHVFEIIPSDNDDDDEGDVNVNQKRRFQCRNCKKGLNQEKGF